MKSIFLAMLLLLFAGFAVAQQKTKSATHNLEAGVAIQGYDPVAYFTQNKAVKGYKKFAVNSGGAVYYFASQANKDAFLKNPASYEPQYGGWCAYAMGATGEKVEIDPETFKILDGKLYLFYHSWTNNTLTKWNKDEASLKSRADKSWIKYIQ
jgi:YHS domain-containing protein